VNDDANVKACEFFLTQRLQHHGLEFNSSDYKITLSQGRTTLGAVVQVGAKKREDV